MLDKVMWPEFMPERAVKTIDAGVAGQFMLSLWWGLCGRRTRRANDTGEHPVIQAKRCEAVMARMEP